MFRLPEGWSRPSRLEDVVVIAGVKIHRSGVAATAPSGEEVVGAAADRIASARDRAWFELAERVCVLEAMRGARRPRRLLTADGKASGQISHAEAFPASRAPQKWVYARSNGVAIHRDWESACRRALWELAERDRVLRSWRGEIVPVPIRLKSSSACAEKTHEWLAYSFPAPKGSFAANVHVVGVFAFPRTRSGPFAIGFAARPVEENALSAALGEATQQLAFLWGEPPPNRARRLPPSAALHLDTYQVHARHDRMRGWLDGAHVRFRPPSSEPTMPAKRVKATRFIDLTTPWLAEKGRVAKAVCGAALPLMFGESPAVRHLPPTLRLHPIP
jgi:hypothetical protein